MILAIHANKGATQMLARLIVTRAAVPVRCRLR